MSVYKVSFIFALAATPRSIALNVRSVRQSAIELGVLQHIDSIDDAGKICEQMSKRQCRLSKRSEGCIFLRKRRACVTPSNQSCAAASKNKKKTCPKVSKYCNWDSTAKKCTGENPAQLPGEHLPAKGAPSNGGSNMMCAFNSGSVTFLGPSNMSMPQVWQVWKDVNGKDVASCMSVLTVALSEGCAFHAQTPSASYCEAAAGSSMIGPWQIAPSTATNPNYNVGFGCDTWASMTNPCCNALKAAKILEVTCIGEVGMAWSGDAIDVAPPFCDGQWTGSSSLYQSRVPGAEAAC